MSKEEIKTIVNNFQNDEDILKFIKERILALESEATEKTVGQGYTDTFNDFISSKVQYKAAASLKNAPCPSLVFDDITPYFQLFKELSTSKEYINELLLFTPLMMNIFNYLSSKESKLDIEDTLYSRQRLYWDYMKSGKTEISIKEFHNQKCGFCSENAGLAHNIFKILGIDSQLVIGQRNEENHAYNIIFPRGYGNLPAVLFDPSYTIDFEIDSNKKYSLGYFKVLTPDEYNNMLLGNKIRVDMSSSATTLIKYYGSQLNGLPPKFENASYSIGLSGAFKVELQDETKNNQKKLRR